MATKKNSNKLSKKARKISQADVIKSIAITSVLLNVLFLVSVFVLTNSTTFNRNVYTSARARYCENSESSKERGGELGDEKKAEREKTVDCIGKDFKPFYQEAIEKYEAQFKS